MSCSSSAGSSGMSGPSKKKGKRRSPSELPPKKKDENENAERNPAEDKKYAMISTESIRMMAESVGALGFTDEMAGKIAEDVTYRLREVLHHASIFVRHSKRNKLLTTDIDEVLEDYDVGRVLGHDEEKPTVLLPVPGSNLFVPDDDVEVDLVEVAFENKELVQPGDIIITERTIPPTFQEATQSDSESSEEEEPVASTSTAQEPPIETTASKLAPHLMNYYDTVSFVLLGCNNKQFKAVVKDFAVNHKIGPVVPYIFNLLAMSLEKVPSKRPQFLVAIMKLSRNISIIELNTYVPIRRLVIALVSCAIETKHNQLDPRDDEFEIKSEIAIVLTTVIGLWCQGNTKLHLDVLQKLGAVLLNRKNPMKSHFGALACLVSLGTDSVEYCLWPVLEQYLSFLKSKPLNRELKEVEGMILDAAEELYQLESSNIFDPNAVSQRINKVNSLLESYFGDALCARLRIGLQVEPFVTDDTQSIPDEVGECLIPLDLGFGRKTRPLSSFLSHNKVNFVPKPKVVTKKYELTDVFDVSMPNVEKFKKIAAETNLPDDNPVDLEYFVSQCARKGVRRFTVHGTYVPKNYKTPCTGPRKFVFKGTQPKPCVFPCEDILMVL